MQTNPRDATRQASIDPEIRAALEGYDHADTVLNEAAFGYRYIRSYLQALDPGARVLEVGSGPCVLLSQVSRDFADLDLTGIEPIGPGFANFQEMLQRLIDRHGFRLLKTGYETFGDAGPFDLIFLVNVFEHLPDWRHFLGFVGERLAPAGRCVILCPNYSFPYESHFGLPIVFGKAFTRRLFRGKIERMEHELGSAGLWDSLNFVKWPAVRAQLPAAGLEARFRHRMLRELIERLDHDPEFARRQRKVAWMARTLLGLGVVRLFETSFFHRFHPYMFLEIARAGTDPASVAGPAGPALGG